MTYKNKITYIFIMNFILVFSFGCSQQDSEDKSNDIMNINNHTTTNQELAAEAKQFLSKYEEVENVYAVQHRKDLLIAIDIEHEDRFQLDQLEKQLGKKLNNHFNNEKITLSTDQKLLFEIEELENKMANKKISSKELKKQIKKLKKLMKEKT